jgi:hypothetical protein
MLDSGAFGAWRRGIRLDLGDYIAFITRNASLLRYYVSLDIIPPEGASQETVEACAAQSYENHQRMRDAGLRPIPVFHQGDAWQWLERYLADGEHYIALSALKKDRRGEIDWLDTCFRLIDTQPSIKVHGLGQTSDLILHLHRWTSVDSATWVINAGNGLIPVPRYRNGRPDYSLPRQLISVTDRSRYAGRAIHVDTATEFELDCVHRYLNEIGIELVEARNSFAHRCQIWIRYFIGLQASCGAEIFLVTSPRSPQHNKLLLQSGARRLISYFDIMNLPHVMVKDVVSGLNRSSQGRRRWPEDVTARWSCPAYWEWRKLGTYRRCKATNTIV